MTVCNRCREDKILEEFSFRKNSKNGRQGICKLCYKEDAKGRDYRPANLMRYKLTVEDFNSMLLKQGGVCKICRGPSLGKGRYHVDHDHKTGKIRGLLCHKCNVALGMVQDSEEHLLNLIKYLREENT